MARFGFLTARFLGGVGPDDLPAVAALEARGHAVVPLVWNEPMPFEGLDALVMRSPWDWYQHRPAFRAFLEGLGRAPVPVFNPPEMLARFADKTYFRELDALGVETVPTVFLSAAELETVPAVLAARGWGRAVLKPSFTANAHDAHRFEAAAADGVVAAARVAGAGSTWMLQPYLEAIEREGEWSLVFFAGRFSHAVQKRPREGDFRVQAEHGGDAGLVAPPEAVRAAAERVVARAVPDAIYARVDGVVLDGRLRVMELEVVEPELFLRLHPEAPSRFAEALLARL